MALPEGITGFYHASSPQGIPSVEFIDFKKQIGGALSSTGHKPLEFIKHNCCNNYHVCTFSTNGSEVGIVGNAIYPIIAFVSPYKDDVLRLNFIDLPEIQAAIEAYTSHNPQ